jgi:hypothetical protein
MMSESPATIKKVIEKHLEEFGFLLRQRDAALRSPDWRLSDINRHEGRIESHLDGLRIATRTGLAGVATHLAGDDPWTIVAACVALLELRTQEAANELVNALLAAEPKQAAAIGRALLHGPIDLVEEQLRAAAESAPPHVAATAIEALLYHGRGQVTTDRLAEFIHHEDPAMRSAGWRIAALG